MKTKKDIKARELAAFCDFLDCALEDAIHEVGGFETENEKVWDAVTLAWDSAFNFTAFDKLVQRNFLRGFEAAWEAFEKAKAEETEPSKTEIEEFEIEAQAEEAETKAEANSRFFYVSDIGNFWPSLCTEVTPAEFARLPELDIEIGNALIVLEKRGDKIALYEYEAEREVENETVLILSAETYVWEAIEVYSAALAAQSNIGKGGG